MISSCIICTSAVKCGSPVSDESVSFVLVMGLTYVALEGDVATFSCSSGFVLTGSNISTCMGNGKWEPDPREVMCEGDNESSKYYVKSPIGRLWGGEGAGFN